MGKKIKLVFKHLEKGKTVQSYLESTDNAEQDQKDVDELIKVWEKDGKWKHIPSN